MLVLVLGLPGVGKSSMVDSLAPRIGAVVVSRDQARLSAPRTRRLIDSLAWKLVHRRLRSTQRRAGRIVAATVERHLGEGRSVIVEAVAEPSFRAYMRDLAAAQNATFVQIECECADRGEHHRRLASRPGFWRHALPRIEAAYLAESTPDVAAVQHDASLRRAGIEPFGWVINSSLAASSTTHRTLRARAAASSRISSAYSRPPRSGPGWSAGSRKLR
jgi:predicted kinase